MWYLLAVLVGFTLGILCMVLVVAGAQGERRIEP